MQKALKTANSEKFVFSCQTSKVVPEPPNSLVFRRKPAPTFAVLRIPFSAPKSLRIPARRARHRLSPLCHRSLFGRKSAQKRPQFRELVLRRVFRGPTARRGPARSPAARRGGPSARRGGPSARRACHQQCYRSVRLRFLVQKALKNGRVRRVRFSVSDCKSKFALFRSKAGSRRSLCSGLRFRPQPAELVTVRHRFVTASSPLSLGPKSAQKAWKSEAGSAALVASV